MERTLGRIGASGVRAWGRVSPLALFALALTIFAWAPLLGPDYFMNAHDAHHSLFFPIEFDRGIRDGYWLPRWGPDFAHGYGYPIFVFYAPLSAYIWEGFHATGLFGVVASTKASFVAGFLLGAAGMFALGRELWGSQAGLLAAVVHSYLPYRLVNIYVRAATAEFLAMALLPWILLAFLRLIARPTLARTAAAAGSYGALLATHNITAVLFTPLLGLFILLELGLRARAEGGLRSVTGRLGPLAGAIALGVLMTTAVWLPGLTEQGNILIEQWALQTYRYEDHFVYPAQLLSPEWGFGFSVPGPGDGMSFQLGLIAVALAGIGLGRLTDRGLSESTAARLIFFGVSLVVLIGLMLPVARPIWELLPLSTLMQFPWRLLAVIALPLALLAGAAAPALGGIGRGLAPGVMIALLLVLATSVSYAQPQLTPPDPRNESQQTWRDYEAKHPDMVGMVAQTRVQPADSPMLAALDANETPERFEAASEGIAVRQLRAGGSVAEAEVAAERPGTVRYLSYWYPGWSATLDGRPVETRAGDGPLGLIEIEVPAGTHRLEVRYGDPPLRRAANLVSLAALAVLATLTGAAAYETLRKIV